MLDDPSASPIRFRANPPCPVQLQTGLSRLIGRNPAYVQQFIKRGGPKKLPARERRVLAHYFNVDEQVLGAMPRDTPAAHASKLVPVARFRISAAAGHGALPSDEQRSADLVSP